jgi:hypothetical protein
MTVEEAKDRLTVRERTWWDEWFAREDEAADEQARQAAGQQQQRGRRG